MPAATDILNLLLRYQEIWFSQFPMLSRRAEWHVIVHLCTKGRDGSPVGELYGLAKQIFLLDDATVKERLSSISQMGLCALDPPGQIYARSIAIPTPELLEKFDAHLRAFAAALADTAGGGPARPWPRAELLKPLEAYGAHWGRAVDLILESGQLSPARRIDARRHLNSSSHWNLVHRAMHWHYGVRGKAAEKDGILADQLAARLLQLTGQTLQTTRDHIAYLVEVGMFQRRPGRALHVVISDRAAVEIDSALSRTADQMETFFDQTGHVDGSGEAVADQTINVAPDHPTLPPRTMQHLFQVIDPDGGSRRVPVRPPLTIGRMAPSDLVLNGADISRTHCRILDAGARVTVEDMRSTNGTFLNDRRLGAAAPLKPGDRLRIGSYVLVYQQYGIAALADPAGETQRARRSGAVTGRGS